MKVKIKKLTDNAVMPSKAHTTDAGFDLTATSRTVDQNGNIVYGTGLAFEIPEGYAGFIFPRSSISKKGLVLTNSVGVVDSHYRGEVMAKFKASLECWEHTDRDGTKCYANMKYNWMEAYEVGDRIAQLIIMPYPDIEFEEATELSFTDRGTGAYGSTGR